MATVSKPIALDESMHTSESPSRNIADVLAEELSGIASAITGGSDKVPKTDVATVEPSTTASRSYSVGELVYVNGNLYKVIASISQGSAFTVGTNIQSTTVSGALNDNSFFIQKTFEHSTAVSISANGYYGINIDTYVCPNGYMPIGVSLLEAGNTNLTIEYYDVNTTRAILRVHNTTASARNALPKMTVTFARIKNVSTS